MPANIELPNEPVEKPQSSNFILRMIRPLIAVTSNEVTRKGALSAIDQGVISVANFIATLILVRFVSATELGVYTVGFLVIYLIRAVQEGLIIQPLNSYGAILDKDEFSRYVSATGVIQLALAAVCSLGAVIVGRILIVTGNDTAGPTMFALWFPFITWQLQEYMRRVFYTRGEVWRATVSTCLANLVRVGLLFFLGVRGSLDGVGGLNAISWGALAAFAFNFWQARDIWTLKGLKLKETALKNWGFGRWILGGTIANWVTVQFYPIITAGLISFAAAGAYQALQNLVAPVHVLLRAADTFLTPRIAKLYHQSGFDQMRKTLLLTYLIAGIPVIGWLVAATYFVKPLLDLLRGHEYLAYAPGIFLMVGFYGLWYGYWPLQTAFKAIRFSKPIFLANLLAIVSMFTVGIWAIHQWGVYGTMGGQALNALIINVVLWSAWGNVKRKNGGSGGGETGDLWAGIK